MLKEAQEKGHSGGDTKVRQLLARWMTHIEREGRSPTTMKGYKRLVKVRINPVLGDFPLKRLDTETLDRFYNALTDDKLAPASVHQIHAIIRAACHQAQKWGWIRENPAALATPPSVAQKPKKVPTPAEVQKMIATAEQEDTDMATLIALAATTGARRGELLGLRWGDVDFAAGTLTIERSVAVIDRHTLVVKDTKTHSSRVLALDEFTLEVFAGSEPSSTSAPPRSGSSHGHTPILTYDLVRPIGPDTASHYVRAVADKAGVDAHLHASDISQPPSSSGGPRRAHGCRTLGTPTPTQPSRSTPALSRAGPGCRRGVGCGATGSHVTAVCRLVGCNARPCPRAVPEALPALASPWRYGDRLRPRSSVLG